MLSSYVARLSSATDSPLELAFAMLAHTTDSRPPDRICLTF